MDRMFARIAAVACVVGVPAAAQVVAPVDVPSPLPTPAATAEADEWLLRDAENRMTVDVTIAGRGEWPFVIDTGAERTVVSRELADELALAPGPMVRVTSMAGSALTPTARVPMLKVSRLAPSMIDAPVYARRNLGAQGMLGLDALQGHRVEIDFAEGRMALTPSERRKRLRQRDTDEIVVVARSRFGQLIVTDAQWRGQRVAVIVDTGSAVTIANGAFLRLIGPAGSGRAEPIGRWTLIAATGEAVSADAYRLNQLRIGTIGLRDVPIAVADVAPFARFGLAKRPALLLGMETLRAFRRVEIDFPNRSIRFTLPDTAMGQG